MKLVHRDIEKDGKGSITLIPEEEEDMWHAYNLLSEGDLLRASTIRKVQTESVTGSSSSNRIRTMLTIRIENIDFDTQACMLRVKGRNCMENQYVKMGAYHTIDLELNRKFCLTKECWDSIFLDRVELACDPSQNADLAAVIMQEGIAHVCLVTAHMTVVRAKIEMIIPHKRKGSCSQHEKALLKFYDSVMQAVLRHINFNVVRCILIASPGFVKDQFYHHIMQQAVKSDIRLLIENKSKFILVHSSSGFKHSLKEILSDTAILSKLSDVKASKEIKALNQFYSVLHSEPCRAYYSLKHVLKAADVNAIETLLITDSLFRSKELTKRKEYVKLVDEVKGSGGEVRLFSSLHISGEQLDQLSGIAAILRFPLPESDDETLEENLSD